MTRTSAARFLLTMQKGGGGVAWLLRDEFTTDEAAPLATPRTAEPGPGTLTLVQTDGQFSISGAKLAFPTQTSAAWGDQGFYGAALDRVEGRALFVGWRVSTIGNGQIPAMWLTGAALPASVSANQTASLGTAGAGDLYDQSSGLLIAPAYVSTATDYVMVSVLYAAGYDFYIKKSGAYYLLFKYASGSVTPLKPAFSNFNGVGTIDGFYVRDLPAPFTSADGTASVNVTNPVSGAAQTATADAITDVTFSLNGSPAADEVAVRLNYRVQDANNKWTAYIKRNAGNTAWDYLVDSVSGGTPTNRLTVTGVGSPTTVRAIYEGSLHNQFSLVTTTWTKRGSQINVSHMNTETAINVEFAAGTTVSALKSFPRTSATYAELDRGL